jgi:hypothetical protein
MPVTIDLTAHQLEALKIRWTDPDVILTGVALLVLLGVAGGCIALARVDATPVSTAQPVVAAETLDRSSRAEPSNPTPETEI